MPSVTLGPSFTMTSAALSPWEQTMEMQRQALRQKTDHDIQMWRMQIEHRLACMKPYTPPTTEEIEAQVDAAYAAAGARLRTLERRVSRKLSVLTKL